jgi:hypothetical protein
MILPDGRRDAKGRESYQQSVISLQLQLGVSDRLFVDVLAQSEVDLQEDGSPAARA